MVKHIVMLDLKETNKKENLIKLKMMLESLLESISTLKGMEVGINFSTEERAMDLSLYATFEDQVGLEAYAIHPAHLEVVQFIKSVATISKVSDYTL
ncbi:MAG: Stress responsive alpha-beta barrel domain protein Dabb [uncultured Sulfurovum sp.]|uniref:Stress responsive alpha-beta barrel domain protein Dabb n=1 Tax=uncultured Sulfurovum sp. TaxID=269237 RepID=A0A6S6U6Q8_9BACT|nr:MAG: Stress responsive alpha-beta barrel domain protein Dabb [uncultured Sulfurovum sp.]